MPSDYRECLPSGETEVTSQNYRGLIDDESALNALEQLEIEDPEESLDEFIEEVPELLSWFEDEGRDYPWRHTTEAWEVYVAEILLQRTRADTVDRVYENFLDHFPNPDRIHESSEDEIRDLIKELGFVNQRTKTLKDVGSIFSEKYDGNVPKSTEGLKEPWRAGEYVARSTQIFARGQPMGLVDPNICRVVSEFMSLELPNQPHKKDSIYSLMENLTPEDPAVARAFYLTLIDYGALEV